MAYEKTLAAVPPQAFTADGTQFGVITIANTAGFKVKSEVVLNATGLPPLSLQIKRVLSPTQFIVGPNGAISPNNFKNISAYTVALGATVQAQEQNKINIPEIDHYKAIYEADPTVADRVVNVDQYGQFYGSANPLPVSFDGTISIGEVSIVQGGNTMTVNPNGSINTETTIVDGSNTLLVNPDGSIDVNATVTIPPGTIPDTWTEIDMDYDSNNNLTEVQFYNGVVVERTLTLSYDSNNNLTKVVPS